MKTQIKITLHFVKLNRPSVPPGTDSVVMASVVTDLVLVARHSVYRSKEVVCEKQTCSLRHFQSHGNG